MKPSTLKRLSRIAFGIGIALGCVRHPINAWAQYREITRSRIETIRAIYVKEVDEELARIRKDKS